MVLYDLTESRMYDEKYIIKCSLKLDIEEWKEGNFDCLHLLQPLPTPKFLFHLMVKGKGDIHLNATVHQMDGSEEIATQKIKGHCYVKPNGNTIYFILRIANHECPANGKITISADLTQQYPEWMMWLDGNQPKVYEPDINPNDLLRELYDHEDIVSRPNTSREMTTEVELASTEDAFADFTRRAEHKKTFLKRLLEIGKKQEV